MDTKINSIDACTEATAQNFVGCPLTTSRNTISCASPTIACEATLGCHLARQLVQTGVKDVFVVHGDFNLTLLDRLIAEPKLRLIGCCNAMLPNHHLPSSNLKGPCARTPPALYWYILGVLSVLLYIMKLWNLPMHIFLWVPFSMIIVQLATPSV
jgi:hypothetical protein